ncbi:RNA-binding KH domain-containing protein RCF3-like [Actinidia eriantha]|uniref:RNA-binding KH domain-containing protein RCF3-like n=1 Tax=Actinidia eriantha TaxID=165200 RepID=UPI00258FA6F6|nr:RNA-binding KH domain-containing protein RCF3-like [Actinidia eriantha]
MDRSRSKRYYYGQDYDYETLPRTKPRYNTYSSSSSSSHHYSPPAHHHRRRSSIAGDGGRKAYDSLNVTTSYRILCHDVKAGGVIGKSGSIIKAIRKHTGALINVHELIPGDEERVIEISDTRRRDPEGRMPEFSPAQEALILIHERILESEVAGYNGDDDEEYGPRVGANRVATRLVVSRMHVGCLLGKGGKIIEQMRVETRTQIRVLPRDNNLPRCVAMSEEIVQVVGDMNAVKNAISIISSRLRESQHRDRSHFHGRLDSPERFFPPDDDFIRHMNNNTSRRTSLDGSTFGSRLSAGMASGRSNNYPSRSSGHAIESGAAPAADNAQLFSGEDLVFQILCPIDKVDSVIGESDGIIELLQNEIGVDVKVADPVAGSDELIIIVSSEEGPDDELFPAQEALLHIQTRIVDLVPEKENIITTRLLVPSGDIGCLEGRDGSLFEIRRLTGANIQILPREELPVCVSGADELVQIVGQIKASREALVEVTSRLRNYIYQEFFQKEMAIPPMLASNSLGTASRLELVSSNNVTPAREGYTGTEIDPPPMTHQNVQTSVSVHQGKDSRGSGSETAKLTESELCEDMPSGLNRIPVPIITRSILEVVIPQYAVPKLITKSKNKLAQISELSGASVKLIEDRPEVADKTIHISGTPEQAERAQSLLQGFILSTQEDAP